MQKLFILIVLLPLSCLGQISFPEDEVEFNFKDIVEIDGLMYLKADTTKVTGKIIRYNRKNIAKKYFIAIYGKPSDEGWVYINSKTEMPKESLLGEVLTAGAVITGAAFAIAGNDLNVPTGNPNMQSQNIIDNDIQNYSKNTREYTQRSYDDMLIKQDIAESYKAKNGLLDENESTIENRIKGTVIDNKKVGVWEEFYNNGQLKNKGNYVKNVKDGLWQYYHRNGALESKENFSDGKKEGLHEIYYDDGQLRSKIMYKNGKENGTMEVYHKNGKLMMEGIFIEAKQIGDWKYYNEAGRLIEANNGGI